jgi:hypothetical protein
VRQALAIDTERLAAFRRFRIVKAQPLDEAPVTGPAGIGHYHIEKRPLLGTASG